ncbi:hypothetical protein N0B31_10205 [Salinirubellus salinus]|uniref:Uncharacterized protein n=1 Tax=Salinirubellus salinus TaxID=1364945 RepID=A0A9E7R6V2_9EURY|nr:hypothetical protein [Salinirubellus salinus]UWM56647.1 hypothetical protein N0B31_10205 [Salinirubellus salinus]
MTALGFIAGIVFMLGDVLKGLVTDSDASLGESQSMGLWMWGIDMTAWMLFGDRDFPFLPDF